MEIKNVGFVVENPAFLIFRDGRKEYDTEKKAQALSGMGANKDAFSCKTEHILITCFMKKKKKWGYLKFNKGGGI